MVCRCPPGNHHGARYSPESFVSARASSRETVIGSLMQAENPKSEARNPKQTRGLNKAQNPEIPKLGYGSSLLFGTFFSLI
jgi:hypothetical protein